MRWIPTKFSFWTAGAAFSRRCAGPARARIVPDEPAVRVRWLAAGLMFAGTASAGEAAAVSSGSATGHWPWIALAAIVGLLGVVSFVSRRRMHTVVGS